MNKSKQYLLAFVIVTTITISYQVYVGLTQNLEYKGKFRIHVDIAEMKLSKNRNKEALEKINYLQTLEPNNYNLYLDKADIYINLKDYKNAQAEIEKAFKQRPILKENSKILLKYIDVLKENYEYEQIEKTIKILEKLDLSKEEKIKVQEIQNDIK
ncbi:MAG: tetratricopeptide repeat protein [Peptostreptococcaceae bacterium]